MRIFKRTFNWGNIQFQNTNSKYEHKNVSAQCERKIGLSKGALVTPSPILLMLAGDVYWIENCTACFEKP